MTSTHASNRVSCLVVESLLCPGPLPAVRGHALHAEQHRKPLAADGCILLQQIHVGFMLLVMMANHRPHALDVWLCMPGMVAEALLCVMLFPAADQYVTEQLKDKVAVLDSMHHGLDEKYSNTQALFEQGKPPPSAQQLTVPAVCLQALPHCLMLLPVSQDRYTLCNREVNTQPGIAFT